MFSDKPRYDPLAAYRNDGIPTITMRRTGLPTSYQPLMELATTPGGSATKALSGLFWRRNAFKARPDGK